MSVALSGEGGGTVVPSEEVTPAAVSVAGSGSCGCRYCGRGGARRIHAAVCVGGHGAGTVLARFSVFACSLSPHLVGYCEFPISSPPSSLSFDLSRAYIPFLSLTPVLPCRVRAQATPLIPAPALPWSCSHRGSGRKEKRRKLFWSVGVCGRE
jgi:hypothetical protein